MPKQPTIGVFLCLQTKKYVALSYTRKPNIYRYKLHQLCESNKAAIFLADTLNAKQKSISFIEKVKAKILKYLWFSTPKKTTL